MGSSSRVLYRSEAAPRTVNPSWMPMEWQYMPFAGDDELCSSDEETQSQWLLCHEIELRVYAIAATAAADLLKVGLASSIYFPSDAGGSVVVSTEPVVVNRLDLRSLVFLGFDILDVLGEMRQGTDSASRVRDGSSSGATDAAPPEAAGLSLDALPLNLLVLWLDDGHYTTPSLYQLLLRGTGGANAEAVSGAERRRAAPDMGPGTVLPTARKLDLRRGLDAANKLILLRRDGRVARYTAQDSLAAVAVCTDGGHEEVDEAAAMRRVHHALGKRRALQKRVELAEARLRNIRNTLVARTEVAQVAATALADVRTLLPDMSQELDGVRDEASLLCHFVSAKRLSLLAELRALYPIVEVERARRYTVRGIVLPDRDLTALPEEQVSTALGYTCHVVALAAKYLGVPLRYLPCHMGSRSTIRDEVLAPTRDFPLFWKGSVTQDEFAVGVLLLQRDVLQLLQSQGVAVAEGHMLGSLQRLFVLLLDAPLPSAIDDT